MPETSRHGYWGPLPGESPELYKAIGTPVLERVILAHMPEFWRGNFNMEAGRSLGATIPPEEIVPPAELTRQERLERLVNFTKTNEIGHVALFAGLSAASAYGVSEGGWWGIGTAVVLGAINIVANVPAIIVQRYNRLRAYRLLDRIGHPRPTPTSE